MSVLKDEGLHLSHVHEIMKALRLKQATAHLKAMGVDSSVYQRLAGCVPTSLREVKPRLKVDKFIETRQIQQCLSDWLQEQHTRDIEELTKVFQPNRDKTAPKPSILADGAPLFSKLVQICPNCKLPPVKTTVAFQGEHEKKNMFSVTSRFPF